MVVFGLPQGPSWWRTLSAKRDSSTRDPERLAVACLFLVPPKSSQFVFLIRASSRETTHASSYYGVWPTPVRKLLSWVCCPEALKRGEGVRWGMGTKVPLLFAGSTHAADPFPLPLLCHSLSMYGLSPTTRRHCAKHGDTRSVLSLPHRPPFLSSLLPGLSFLSPAPCFPEIFLSFSGCTHRMWKFSDQGLNPTLHLKPVPKLQQRRILNLLCHRKLCFCIYVLENNKRVGLFYLCVCWGGHPFFKAMLLSTNMKCHLT